MTGTVRWFEPKRGFGFIQPDDGTPDIFVHCSSVATDTESTLPGDTAVTAALEPGEKVEFDVVEAPYGRQATRVRRVEPSAPADIRNSRSV